MFDVVICVKSAGPESPSNLLMEESYIYSQTQHMHTEKCFSTLQTSTFYISGDYANPLSSITILSLCVCVCVCVYFRREKDIKCNKNTDTFLF